MEGSAELLSDKSALIALMVIRMGVARSRSDTSSHSELTSVEMRGVKRE